MNFKLTTFILLLASRTLFSYTGFEEQSIVAGVADPFEIRIHTEMPSDWIDFRYTITSSSDSISIRSCHSDGLNNYLHTMNDNKYVMHLSSPMFKKLPPQDKISYISVVPLEIGNFTLTMTAADYRTSPITLVVPFPIEVDNRELLVQVIPECSSLAYMACLFLFASRRLFWSIRSNHI